MYFTESLVKVSLSFLGYNIPAIKLPLNVLNPVLKTMPLGSVGPIFLFWTNFVPANNIYFSYSGSLVS